MDIGKNLYELRKKNGITQETLAFEMGVSVAAVSKWENDATSPDTLNLVKIADALDTEVEYLATGKKPVYQPAPVVVTVAEKVDRIVERVVEKPVIRKVVRVKYLRTPVEFLLLGAACFVLGLLCGLFFW